MDFSSLEPVTYDVSAPTTAGLYRGGGRFVKVLRSYRDWPMLPVTPELADLVRQRLELTRFLLGLRPVSLAA
jgi:hypothetical protein